MNTCSIVTIAIAVYIAFSLSIFFGIRHLQRVKNSLRSFEPEPPKYQTHKVLHLYLNRGAYTDGLNMFCTSHEILTLPGYKKYIFDTSNRDKVHELLIETNTITLEGDIFEKALVFTWFDKPLLIIINTIVKENENESKKVLYYTSTGDFLHPYSRYPIVTDIQHDSAQIDKLLKKINKDLGNIISIDIAYDINKHVFYTELNDNVKLTVYKDEINFRPFAEIKSRVNSGIIDRTFQIDELKYNDATLQIKLPSLKLNSFYSYLWNGKPILLMADTIHNSHYYTLKSSDEWTPLVNEFGSKVNFKLSDKELMNTLKKNIFTQYNALFLDISKNETYEYLGKEITVIKEDVEKSGEDPHFAYTHLVQDSVFKLGACSQNSVIIKSIPTGQDLESLTVYKKHMMAYMIKMVVFEDGAKHDKYYVIDKSFNWNPSPNAKSAFENVDSSNSEFFQSFSDVIDLNIGKKTDYPYRKVVGSEKSRNISVKFLDKYEPYTIYVHQPESSQKGSPNQPLEFKYNNIIFNGVNVSGILPGHVTKMLVYFLDDSVPVGIEIFTKNGTSNYVNKGNNMWQSYAGSPGKYMLSPDLFIKSSRSFSFFVGLDVGFKSLHISQTENPLIKSKSFGNFIEHTLRLSSGAPFIFEGIAFKGHKYAFDSASLFLNKFTVIKIYYSVLSDIPLYFQLLGSESFGYYNDLAGRWVNLPGALTDPAPLIAAVHLRSQDAILIDKFSDYTIFGHQVKVTSESFNEHYVKFVHSVSQVQKFHGIIYHGYFIKDLPVVKHIMSVAVYFRKGFNEALLIEINPDFFFHTLTNRGDGTWSVVEGLFDVSQVLNEVYSKLAPNLH